MRRKAKTFFGRRLIFVVRLPMSAFPTPYPDFTPPGKCQGMRGYWERQEGDVHVITHIAELHCNRQPKATRVRKLIRSNESFELQRHFIELEYSYEDPEEPGDPLESWTCWEGEEYRYRLNEAGDKVTISRSNLPLDVVTAYRACCHWADTYGRGIRKGDVGPVIAGFHEAAGWVKAMDPTIYPKSGVVDLVYRLRTYGWQARLGFCSAMSRALKTAKRHGVRVKVL